MRISFLTHRVFTKPLKISFIGNITEKYENGMVFAFIAAMTFQIKCGGVQLGFSNRIYIHRRIERYDQILFKEQTDMAYPIVLCNGISGHSHINFSVTISVSTCNHSARQMASMECNQAFQFFRSDMAFFN